MRSAVTLVVVGSLALTLGVRAQQPPPSSEPPQPAFRTGVDLVQVDVSVLDKDRLPVQGLAATDFTVKEDGKVRPAVAFSMVEIPPRPSLAGAAPWTRDIAPDVITNEVPREGRLVVILFDRTIRAADRPSAQRTAQAVVDQLGPADLAAVVYTSRGVPQNFTSDRRLLRSAITRPTMGLSDADLQNTGEAGSREEDALVERGNPGECRCGVCSLDAMTRIADALKDVPQRRKMLVFLGSMLPVQTASSGCGGMVKDSREKLFRAAGVANLAIHTFDTNRLETGAAGADVRSAPARGGQGSMLQRQGDLSVYPDRTGGRAVVNSNAPETLVPAIFAESRSYYVLGFEPANPKKDGKFHNIEVTVNRPGVSVHPRQGYYAPATPTRSAAAKPGGPPPSLVAALSGLWPTTEVPLSVTVAAFANPGPGSPLVSVVMHARESLTVEGGAGPQRINVLAGAYDAAGKSLDFHVQSIEVTPRPDTPRALEYEVSSRLTLKPGRHEIRVAAENVTRGTSGSVYTYVDVPDFAKAPLSLSGVVLGVGAGTGKAAGPLGDVLPFVPIAARAFSPADHVTAFVRIYQSGAGAPVTLNTRILDASNQAVFEQRVPAFEGTATGFRSAEHRVELPLAQLKPGEYLLVIDAGGQKPGAARDVRFTVR
jgi:VWFA-related protein